jgi:hypothetical protein
MLQDEEDYVHEIHTTKPLSGEEDDEDDDDDDDDSIAPKPASVEQGRVPQGMVRHGRPDLLDIFTQMKAAAVEGGQTAVGVLTCGPTLMMGDVMAMCDNTSDENVNFECSAEAFEF